MRLARHDFSCNKPLGGKCDCLVYGREHDSLNFVDSDRERETDWELTTFQFEGKVCVVFCQQERDERDEFGLAVAVPSNDVVKFTVDPEDRESTFTSIDTVIDLGSERDESEC